MQCGFKVSRISDEPSLYLASDNLYLRYLQTSCTIGLTLYSELTRSSHRNSHLTGHLPEDDEFFILKEARYSTGKSGITLQFFIDLFLLLAEKSELGFCCESASSNCKVQCKQKVSKKCLKYALF